MLSRKLALPIGLAGTGVVMMVVGAMLADTSFMRGWPDWVGDVWVWAFTALLVSSIPWFFIGFMPEPMFEGKGGGGGSSRDSSAPAIWRAVGGAGAGLGLGIFFLIFRLVLAFGTDSAMVVTELPPSQLLVLRNYLFGCTGAGLVVGLLWSLRDVRFGPHILGYISVAIVFAALILSPDAFSWSEDMTTRGAFALISLMSLAFGPVIGHLLK
jgi:hypothetical protein